MADELTHLNTVTPNKLTRAEWEAIDAHILDSGVQGDFLYWDTASGSLKRIAHAADLDAHMPDLFQTIRTGEYFLPLPLYNTSITGLSANRIFATPFFVARDMTIDRLAIQITTAGAGGTVARLGIYNNGTNLYPGTLLLDAGTVAVDAIAVVAATISQALTKGLYWLVCVTDGTPVAELYYPAWSPMGHLATDFTKTGNISGWYKNAVGIGALADPFVVGATKNQAWALSIMPRLLTLD